MASERSPHDEVELVRHRTYVSRMFDIEHTFHVLMAAVLQLD